jgi:hypothetical protein
MMVEGKPDFKVQEQVSQPDILSDMKFYGMHRHLLMQICSGCLWCIKKDLFMVKQPMNVPAKQSRIR